MFAFTPTASVRASSLVGEHDWRARQVITDKIVAAIRSGDLENAKWWGEVGVAADDLLHERARADVSA